MMCPKCGSQKMSIVLDTREKKSENVTRRRRECTVCGCRYTTYERVDKIIRKKKRPNENHRRIVLPAKEG